MSKWSDLWKSDGYKSGKTKNFSVVDSYIKFEPKNILDIGCGYARESKCFQEKYNSNLYLLDGNPKKDSQKRQIKYGSAESMDFYNSIEDLKKYYDSENMRYNFIDAANPIIPKDIKFDLIYSFLSCGFHYPANTYKELIQKHSTEDTLIIFDIRHLNKQKNIQILDIVNRERKSLKCSIKFVDGENNEQVA